MARKKRTNNFYIYLFTGITILLVLALTFIQRYSQPTSVNQVNFTKGTTELSGLVLKDTTSKLPLYYLVTPEGKRIDLDISDIDLLIGATVTARGQINPSSNNSHPLLVVEEISTE